MNWASPTPPPHDEAPGEASDPARELLLVGFGAEALSAAVGPAPVHRAPDRDTALSLLARRRIGVVALGPGLAATAAAELLARLPIDRSTGLPLVLLLGLDPSAVAGFPEALATGRVFYSSRRLPDPATLSVLIESALRRCRAGAGPDGDDPTAAPAAGDEGEELGALLHRLPLLEEPGELAELLTEAATRTVEAGRACCLFHDRDRDVLWTDGPAGHHEWPAGAGTAGLVVRTGTAIRLAHGGDGAALDGRSPEEGGDERVLAAPITLPDGTAVGVLMAMRGPARAEFTAADEDALARLADLTAPHVGNVALARRDRSSDLGPESDQGPFRRTAVERLRRGVQIRRNPLKLDPGWGRVAYWLPLLALGGGLLFATFGRVDEYATGVGVVELGGRTNVTAVEAGTATAVRVTAGERVAAGGPLVQLDDSRERTELAALDEEFQLRLVKRLRDPSDTLAEQSLLAVRAERELAAKRLAGRTLRAPAAGAVSDVWVRPGQFVHPGDLVVSLAGGEATPPRLTILVPGSYRPSLRPGMPVRFEVAGYRYAYQHLEVEAVGDEVVGPTEAERYLGAARADAVAVSGPVVVVRARLPSTTFQAEGGRFRYHQGMHGKAEIRVRSQRILVVLFPALEALFARDDA